MPRRCRGPATSRWIRKSRLDERLHRFLPIPTQIVSNEEFDPLPQTPAQRGVEAVLDRLARASAARLGVGRRAFLRSAGGMAAAFMAMNTVFGRFFDVEAAEISDPAAAAAGRPDHFVLDVQTHHVDVPPPPTEGDRKFLEYLLRVRGFGGQMNPALAGREIGPGELARQNFIKEIFLDSQTDVAVVSGLPQWTPRSHPLSPDSMAATRDAVNELTGSRRVLTQGIMSPELGPRNLDLMRSQAENLKVSAWKGYPGQPLGPDGAGWWLDDEKTSYPALELARKLGIRHVALHKGLPAPGFSDEHCDPKDIFKAAVDFPDLNFLVYHGGFKSVREVIPAVETGFAGNPAIPWVTDLCTWKKKHPEVKNVYMELGSTFGMTAIGIPLLCAHILGMILDAFGDDHLLWGTDAIWWGSPQWQIEAFTRFEMPESLAKRFGWKPLTREVKAKVLGLNAARLHGIDPKEARKPVPGDYVDRLREIVREEGGTTPSNTQYGWVRS